MTSALPEQVRELIRAAVDSYEKLYVLDALSRADGPLEIGAICQRVSLPHSVVEDALTALWRCGAVLLRAKDQYEYDRTESARNAGLSALIELLEHHPLELAQLMDKAAMERARTALHDRLRAGFVHQHLRHHGRRTP